MAPTDETCPRCGAALPREVGQHAPTPSAGVVKCPTCGATVRLDRPGAPRSAQAGAGEADVPRAPETRGGEEGAPETFAGQEEVEGVMDELRDKPQ
jgi:uncharacterized Zn finger protein (UPF0148 family)